MNDFFPRIITLLRKERGFSQKKVAADLNVSQALLSHYEKGVRECGLDFVVRVADYYGVSCDYLLGRTPDRTGAMLTVEDLPDADAKNSTDKVYRGSIVATLNKKLIVNSLQVVFDLLQRSNSKQMTNELSAYFMVAVYRAFRILYCANPKNPSGIFRAHPLLADGQASAAMQLFLSNASCIARRGIHRRTGRAGRPALLAMTPEALKESYPYFQQSLFNLIQRAESML